MNKILKTTITTALLLSSIGLAANAVYISDSEIKQSVDNLYNHYPEIDNSVGVEVHQGRIILDGKVCCKRIQAQAKDLVEDLPGVKGVNNLITIENDSQLKRKVKSTIYFSRKLDSDLIRISVNSGIVTLEGRVKDLQAKEIATDKAFKAGARDVRNKLDVIAKY